MTQEEVLKILKKKSKDWNMSTIATNVGYRKSSLSEAMAGNRGIPDKYLPKFEKEFKRMSTYLPKQKDNGKDNSKTSN